MLNSRRRRRSLDEHLYEVHVTASEEGPWEHASGFDALEDARIEAIHLIRDTSAHRVRVIHVVDYYQKTPAGQA